MNMLAIPTMQPMCSDFPVEALPQLACAACRELAWAIKVTLSMTGSCMIPAMATAVQDTAVLKLPNGKRCPLMVYSWTNAENGSGKTPVDDALFEPFRQHDREAKVAFEKARVAYDAEIRVWNTEAKALQKKLRVHIERGAPAEDARRKLLEHASRMPSKPRLRQIVYRNVSEAALFEALEGQGGSVAIVFDEARDIQKDEVMSNLSLQNSIWSGASSLPVNRAYGRYIQISHPRMTLSLMTHPDTLEKLMDKMGNTLRASGYVARFLFACPTSMKGHRQLSYAEDGYEKAHLAALHERFRVLLRQRDERFASGDVEPEVLEFSDDAKGLWIDIHNANEDAMRPGCYMEAISDFGSKVMENLSRIAAILHLFEGQTGPISRDTLQRAASIMHWYGNQFMMLFGPGARPPQVVVNANKLLVYLRGRWIHTEKAPFHGVQKNAPVRGADFEAALLLLQSRGVLRVILEGRKRFIVSVSLTPVVPDYSVLSPSRSS